MTAQNYLLSVLIVTKPVGDYVATIMPFTTPVALDLKNANDVTTTVHRAISDFFVTKPKHRRDECLRQMISVSHAFIPVPD